MMIALQHSAHDAVVQLMTRLSELAALGLYNASAAQPSRPNT